MAEIEKRENVTIKMISEKAKVSKTTVSRFLNGKYDFMSDKTRERIQSIVEDLDYRPNHAARSLKSKKTGFIGMTISDIENPFSSILIKGVSDACMRNEFQLIIANADNSPIKERRDIDSLIDRQVEGIVIYTTGENNEYIKELHEQGVKIVIVDRPLEKLFVDTVTTDSEEATAKMIHQVYQAGFERIAFFTQPSNNIPRILRHKAFLDASKQYVEHPEKLVYIAKEHVNNAEEYVDMLKDYVEKNKGHKLAIFTVNGVVMLNVVQAMNILGLNIPKDIAVCGYDDLNWTNVVGNGISVIAQPSYEVGFQGAKLLIERIKNEEKDYVPKYIEMTSELKMRGSTQLEQRPVK